MYFCRTYLRGLFWEVNETGHAKLLEQYLAHIEESINVSHYYPDHQHSNAGKPASVQSGRASPEYVVGGRGRECRWHWTRPRESLGCQARRSGNHHVCVRHPQKFSEHGNDDGNLGESGGKIIWRKTQRQKERQEILPHATSWMTFEDIKLSERSQTQKDKWCLTSLYTN